MRTYQQWLNYQQQELITPSQPPPRQKVSVLQQIWRYLQQVFALNDEPQIKQRTDPSGKTWWQIYDPVSDQSLQLQTKQEVLIWLEERHHQRSETFTEDAYSRW